LNSTNWQVAKRKIFNHKTSKLCLQQILGILYHVFKVFSGSTLNAKIFEQKNNYLFHSQKSKLDSP